MAHQSGPAGAAFFDLDRTLLSGGSGPIIGEALRRVGLLPERSLGIESVLFKVFDVIGETWPSMLLTRQGARMSKGWSVDLVHKAARMAAEPLADAVLPYAHHLLDQHRDAGRPLVMATTTPIDLIRPLADALGFDDVIATTYGRHDGQFDGTIDGEFVWGKGKARAVAEWAGSHDVDLGASYAYSDSYYDTPLLSIVGHPQAVNPDPRMIGVATLRRWPIVHLDVPAGVPKFAGVEPQRALFLLAQAQLLPWVRFTWTGSTASPRWAPAIIVANHRSYLDPLAIGYLLAKRDGRSGSWARRRCSTRRSSGTWPRRSAASGWTGEPVRTSRSAPRQGRPGRRRDGGDHAAGHHPARSCVLRSGAQGPVGRGAPGPRHRCAHHPDRALGHRAGVAAQCEVPRRDQRVAPADRPHPGRATRSTWTAPTWRATPSG